ncbi:hypothetical protein PUN28_002890 [Cardiocondyla obscurior]|uniref:L-serine deaminase n=1 Tax=Cardiocondyla obscurior TaxID=286306 RepID=A0AAW2GWK8_9HYME
MATAEGGNEQILTKFSYDIARALFLFVSSPRIVTRWIHSPIDYHHRILFVKGYIQERGAVYALHQIKEKGVYDGVVAVSIDGSFAAALSYYGQKYQLTVTVVVPLSIHRSHVELCTIYGANLINLTTNNPADLHNEAVNIARTRGLAYIDRYDHPDIIIGQATLGIDILDNILEQRSIDLEENEKKAKKNKNLKDLPTKPPAEFAVLLPTASNNSALSVALAIAIKERDPTIQIYEIRPTSCDLGNSGVRRLTKSTREVAGITPSKYTWFTHFNFKRLFDSIFIINNAVIGRYYQILQRQGFNDIDAAICFAAIECRRFQLLQGKTFIIPMFGDMEWSPDFVREITSDSVPPGPDVPGPANA